MKRLEGIKIKIIQFLALIVFVLVWVKAKIFGDFKPRGGLISHYSVTEEFNEAVYIVVGLHAIMSLGDRQETVPLIEESMA